MKSLEFVRNEDASDNEEKIKNDGNSYDDNQRDDLKGSNHTEDVFSDINTDFETQKKSGYTNCDDEFIDKYKDRNKSIPLNEVEKAFTKKEPESTNNLSENLYFIKDEKKNTNHNNSNENININKNNQDKNSNNGISPASKKIASNSISSKIIGFKDIEKRLEGTEYEFKSNAEIEAREEKIKEEMHKNKNNRSKNSADNLHTKVNRYITNYSFRNSMNSILEKKKIRVKKLSNRTMEISKQKNMKELMEMKFKDIFTQDRKNTHNNDNNDNNHKIDNNDIIEKFLSDSPISELTQREYASYVIYETNNLNVNEEIKSKIFRADKILNKFKEKNSANFDKEYYYKFLYHLFNFNWYIENIKGREKEYKKRHKSKEKKKERKKNKNNSYNKLFKVEIIKENNK